MDVNPSPSNTPSPRISVIVTAHDRLSYLSEALGSLAQQDASPSDFEILLISNMEEGTVRPVVRSPRVRVLTENSASLGQKIATALRYARAPLITFLEDDDAFHPHKLSALIEEYDRHPELGYLHNHYSLMDAQGHPLPPSAFRARADRLLRARGGIRIDSHTRWDQVQHLAGVYPEFNNSCISVRRELLAPYAHLLPLADLATDQFLWLVALRSPWCLSLDERRLTTVRLHGANASQISEASRSMVPQGLLEVSQRNVQALDAVGETLKEGQPSEYRQIVDSVLAVEKALLDLRGAEIRRARYREDFGQLMRLRSSYVVKTRRPLLLATGTASLSPAVALSFYRTMGGRIS